jgi:hypothetical protein
MEPAHTFGPRTTATSNAEERMKVDAVGAKKKKKIIRDKIRMVRKKR